MDMKCSMHVGGKWSVKHNLRDYDPDKWNKDEHIDEERKELNNVLTYTEYREFIDETFGDALMAFNESQRKKHPERLIGFDSGKAYDRTPPEKRRSKAVSAYAREHRKDVQEVIIQLGDHNEYKAMVAEHGQEQADELYHDYLKECYYKWLKDNSTFKPFCAVIHMDEIKDGTPHIHVTFLATAESSRGLKTKVSVEGALSALDYKRKKDQLYEESPYRRWLKDTRKAYEDFAQEYVDRHDLGIKILPSDKSVVHHQEPPAYKEKKAVKAAQEQLQQLQKKNLDLTTSNDELTFDNNDLTEQNEQLTTDNKALTEQKEQLTADNQTLTEQKNASSDEIDALGRTLEGLRATTTEARQNNALALKWLVEGLPDPPERPEGERYADWEKWKVNHHPRDKNGNLLKEGSWKWRKAMEEEHKRHTEHNAPWLEFDRLFQEWWEKAEQVEAVKKLQEQYGSDLSAVAEQKTELDARERQIADKERSLAQRTARFNSEVDEAAEKKVTKYRERAEKAEEKAQRIKDRANDIIDRLNQEHDQELGALKEENLNLKKELGIEEEEVLDLTDGYNYDRGY